MKVSAAAIGAVLLMSTAAPAQLVAPAGTVDVMLTVQQTHIDAHSNPRGVFHNIDLRSWSAIISAEYSVTDRLAVGLSLPYIQSRYRGSDPHPTSVWDDGSTHGSLQDLQLDARYALLRGDFVLSPFARFRYPVRDYEISGHASPGRGLKELEIGFSGGHQLRFEQFAIAANLSYTVSEKSLDDIRVNRTNADVHLGYAPGHWLFLRGFGAWQRSHGGFDLPLAPTSPYFHFHDQMARSNSTSAGAAATLSLSESVNVHLGFVTTIKSMNGHRGRSVSAGLSRTFFPR